MSIPHSDLKAAREHARLKAEETGHVWYVNRLASSGIMRYEVSDRPITDTSFGGGLVSTIHTAWCAINQPTLICTCAREVAK